MPRSDRPPSRNQPHTLVEPRLVAAVGLVALGGGIGIALMLAHTLVFLGFVISLTAAGGVIWIYSAHLVEVYKALSSNTIYRGPNIKEISVALAMVLVFVPLAVYLYFAHARPDYLARGRLQYDHAFPVKDPRTSEQWVNFELKNSGTLAATRAVVGAIGKLSSATLAAEAAKKEMDDLRAEVFASTPPKESTILPHHSAVITFPNLSITDADIDAINQGKSTLNVFIVTTYEDEALEGEGYWVTEFCGYYILTLSYWHNCTLVPERVYRMQGLRREH
jgi:hypothetical protein